MSDLAVGLAVTAIAACPIAAYYVDEAIERWVQSIKRPDLDRETP